MSTYTPDNFVRSVPGFSDILVQAEPRGDDNVFVCYIGLGDDLIAAGVAPEGMIEGIPRQDRCRRRTDAEGHRYWKDSYFVSRDGKPVRRYRIRRPELPKATALRMAGVREALESYERRKQWYAATPEIRERASLPQDEGADDIPRTPEPRNAAPHLRLVVNNTHRRTAP
jgi:hypothetical protein